ncbi:MAG: ADP-ribose-binding protein [Desulfuromonadales bacterium GWD2_54_10]|nr:MAG: ADP-ribose-binding protein [Desulfuromonadales bacterium GWD2_54_10]
MHEISGDIWSFLGQATLCVTTNGSVTKDGRAVLGRGCARQAGERFPDLARILGGLLQQYGNHVHLLGNGLVSFPVEETAWSLPDLHLIQRSAHELLGLAESEQWNCVLVPRPGCGYGGLDWNLVRPLLEPLFDQRFTLIKAE